VHALALRCINQYTKFEVPSFTNYKEVIGAKLENGSRDSDTHLALSSKARI